MVRPSMVRPLCGRRFSVGLTCSLGTSPRCCLTYALGHRVEYYDMPYVRAILKESSKTDYRFSSLVLGIIKSPAFQRRRSES